MDLLTQGLLGAAAATVVCHSKLGRKAVAVGLVAGLLPDADVLLAPISDPAFPFEYHRHFTHALLMVPLLAALSAAFFMPLKSYRENWQWVFIASLIATLTHAPLDWATSWGTMILWPFTEKRFALDWIAVIDPLYTLPLIFGLMLFLIKPSRFKWHHLACFILASLYMSIGAIQCYRAYSIQSQIAEARGHNIEHGRVNVTLGNTVVWRSMYRHQGMMYADGLRLPYFGQASIRPGTSLKVYHPSQISLSQYSEEEQAWINSKLEKLYRFSEGYMGMHPNMKQFKPGHENHGKDLVCDMRYSLSYTFDPLWGMAINPEAEDNKDRVKWARMHAARYDLIFELLDTIIYGNEAYLPIETALEKIKQAQ